MASPRALKNRIKSTKNIAQITKAMETVSAAKMRKSQMVALRSRPFAQGALRILRNVKARLSEEFNTLSPLLFERPVQKTCLVVVTSDKGLAGAFNSSVIRRAEKFLAEKGKENISIIAVGKKAKDFFGKRATVSASFTGFGDYIEMEETSPLAKKITNIYTKKEADEIFILYTNFLSALKQEVVLRKILPFSEENIEEIIGGIAPEKGKFAEEKEKNKKAESIKKEKNKNASPHIFEPSPAEVMEKILPSLIEIQIYHSILEANASEHSSRMMAMRNARDNAGEFIDELTLKYNTARQAGITKELIEITGGAAALET